MAHLVACPECKRDHQTLPSAFKHCCPHCGFKWEMRFKIGHRYWMTGWSSDQKIVVEIVDIDIKDKTAFVKFVDDPLGCAISPPEADEPVMTTHIALLGSEVK